MPAVSPAWDTASATNTPSAATAPCLTRRESGTQKMPEKPIPTPCPASTCSAAVFRARRSAVPALAGASETPAAPFSLSLPAWLKPGTLAICCLRTWPICFTMTKAGRLQRSSIRWTDWGTMSNGRCSTAKILAFPSQDAGYTLSDFLTPDVPERYYLSPAQQKRLLPDDWGKDSR